MQVVIHLGEIADMVAEQSMVSSWSISVLFGCSTFSHPFCFRLYSLRGLLER
ncbi:uncharacterized protein DS421_7g216830 [Arachis hypogaea]|nr:uncharacterized protein DS421_7g216830 [Arachis hypogaea]